MGIMHVDVEYKDIGGVDKLMGISVVLSRHVPRPGAVVNVLTGELYVHPDEEHMVWASIGEVEYAFDMLDRTVKRQINRHARHAEEKLRTKTASELRHELDDRIARLHAIVQD